MMQFLFMRNGSLVLIGSISDALTKDRAGMHLMTKEIAREL